jgi:hypothetical protein
MPITGPFALSQVSEQEFWSEKWGQKNYPCVRLMLMGTLPVPRCGVQKTEMRPASVAALPLVTHVD